MACKRIYQLLGNSEMSNFPPRPLTFDPHTCWSLMCAFMKLELQYHHTDLPSRTHSKTYASEKSQSKLGRTGQRRVYMATAQDNPVMTADSRRWETSSCNLASTLDLPALSPSEAAAAFPERQIKAEMKLQTNARKEIKQKKRAKTAREQR